MGYRVRSYDKANGDFKMSKEGWIRRIFGSADGGPG